MKANRIFAIGALIISCLLVLPFVLPSGGTTAIYYSVNKATHGSIEGVDWIAVENSEDKFIFYKDKLYLLFQVEKSTVFFPIVKTEPWDSIRLLDLRANHNELQPYWPDTDASNLGVKWISAQKPR